MRRQAVDVVLLLPEDAPKVAKTATKQSAWLRTTRVPLRSIAFEASGFLNDAHVIKQQRACQKLAVSRRMLAASRRTLKAMTAFPHGCLTLVLDM